MIEDTAILRLNLVVLLHAELRSALLVRMQFEESIRHTLLTYARFHSNFLVTKAAGHGEILKAEVTYH